MRRSSLDRPWKNIPVANVAPFVHSKTDTHPADQTTPTAHSPAHQDTPTPTQGHKAKRSGDTATDETADKLGEQDVVVDESGKVSSQTTTTPLKHKSSSPRALAKPKRLSQAPRREHKSKSASRKSASSLVLHGKFRTHGSSAPLRTKSSSSHNRKPRKMVINDDDDEEDDDDTLLDPEALTVNAFRAMKGAADLGPLEADLEEVASTLRRKKPKTHGKTTPLKPKRTKPTASSQVTSEAETVVEGGEGEGGEEKADAKKKKEDLALSREERAKRVSRLIFKRIIFSRIILNIYFFHHWPVPPSEPYVWSSYDRIWFSGPCEQEI
jgi:hypothetical protein